MKTILVDAINGFVLEDGSILEPMHKLLESYPNNKLVLTGANDEQFKHFKLDQVPYEVFTLKHNPEKTDPQYFKILLENMALRPKTLFTLNIAQKQRKLLNLLALRHIFTTTLKQI